MKYHQIMEIFWKIIFSILLQLIYQGLLILFNAETESKQFVGNSMIWGGELPQLFRCGNSIRSWIELVARIGMIKTNGIGSSNELGAYAHSDPSNQSIRWSAE